MNETIGYLGPKGTNSEYAAHHFAQSKWTPHMFDSINNLFDALLDHNCDAIVTPIENSTEGAVTQVLDTWLNYESCYINDAYLMPISYHLYSLNDSPLSQIKTIMSHPQCYAQTQKFITMHCPQADFIPSVSSAKALEDMLKYKDQSHIAIIGNTQLATHKNLQVLAENIETQADNCTLFVLLSKTWEARDEHQYLSLAFSTQQNSPGSLAKVLSIISSKGINLSRIISRPSKKSFGEYIFYIDLECSPKDHRLETLLEAIKSVTIFQKILGSYSL